MFVPESPKKLVNRLKEIASDANKAREEGDELQAKALWKRWHNLSEACADIRFTYAMTINKAQGVTLKHALVDLDDISKCRDRSQKARYAYTAVTRATDYVTIEGDLA